MRKDTRLSRTLHVLLHMGGTADVMTSGQIATMLDTNAVVVRRTMAGLREAGIVQSKKGRGGGWSLLEPLESISLLEVHKAVSGDELFCIGWTDSHSGCLVEQSVNSHIGEALQAAEELLLGRLGTVTLGDIATSMDLEEFEAFHTATRTDGVR
jgi:DNA-binding IscR family transcriptional regulator